MTSLLLPARIHPRQRHPSFMAAVAVVLAMVFAFFAAPAQAAPQSRGEYLIAADPTAETISAYRTSDLKRTGELSGIKLSSHLGTVQLPDGRLIMVDDAAARVVALRVNSKGKPRIVQSAPINSEKPWNRATWGATDADLRYFAFSSDFADSSSQLVTVVDLRTFAIHHIDVPLTANAAGEFSEVQVYLAGRPLQLVVTTGGRFTAYPMKKILQDRPAQVSSTAPLGPNNHGPVVSPDGDHVFSTTADGLDGVAIPNANLGSRRSVAYSANRNVVQNYRPRLAGDGRTVCGSVTEDTGLAASDWVDTRNDLSLIDTKKFTSALVRLPDGIASRVALSKRYAAVSTQHPDGDVLTLVDAAPGSAAYRRIVGTVALDAPTGGPVAGTPASGTQGHFVALNPSGRRAFVSNGGDGTITVVDTDHRRVIRTLDASSPLTGGGYLTVVKPGTALVDLIAR